MNQKRRRKRPNKYLRAYWLLLSDKMRQKFHGNVILPILEISWNYISLLLSGFKGLGKAKRHFWGVFKSFKSIILGVTQPLGIFFM